MNARSFSGYTGSYRFFKPCSLKTSVSDDEMRSTRATTINTLLDEEGVRSEEVKRLRGSVSAYKGHLTKAYNEIRFLCANAGSLSEIITRKSSLDDLFARFTTAVQSLLQKLGDLEDQEQIARNFYRDANEKDLFDEEFAKWINSARHFAFIETGLAHVSTSRELPRETPPYVPREITPDVPRETPPCVPRETSPGFSSETPLYATRETPAEVPRETPPYIPPEITPEVPRETPPCVPRETSPGFPRETPPVTQLDASREIPREQLRQRGPGSTANGFSFHGSRRSRTSRSSMTKLAVAQLRMKKLEEEQKLKTREHELEKQRLQLEMEKQLLNARTEIEQAQIELSVESGDSSDVGDRPSILPSLPKQSLYETVDRYFASCENDRPRTAPTPLLQPVKSLPSRDISNRSVDLVNSSEVQNILKSQQEAMKHRDEAVRLVVSGLEKIEMPKREFITFDGDPKRYPQFIKSFEINVERRVKEDDEKLSYLIQYCKGAAKDAIENCVMLPPEKGYQEAKEILRKNFGQKHTIVRAFIDKVVKGPQIRTWESAKLSQLARDMKSCALNSEHMRYKADINSMDTLKKTVVRLPSHLQAKWAEEANKLIEAGIEPEFSHLTDFVEKRAAVANTAFGKLVGARPEGDSKPKSRRRSGSDVPACVTTLAIQSTKGNRTSDGQSVRRSTLSPVSQGTSMQAASSPCLFCNGNHSLERCFKFRDKTFEERKEFVMTRRLCSNCLRENHLARRCRAARACLFSGCGKRHHSLLHPPPTAAEGVEITAGGNTPETSLEDGLQNSSGAGEEAQCAAIESGRSRVSLQIVPVKVRGEDGGPEIITYAFLDNGSDTTLCLNSLAESLGVSGKPVHFSLSSINAENTPRSGYEVALKVTALDGDDPIFLDKVWTVARLPISKRSVPSDEDVSQWPHLKDLKFPRINGEENAVGILIGNDVPEAHWVYEERRGRRKQPYAVKTPLGWTLIGRLGGSPSPQEARVNFIRGGQEMLSSQLRRMYNAEFSESLASSSVAMSGEDRRALAILENSARLIDDHYQIALPWRYKPPSLKNNRSVALRSLHSLERRFQKDPSLMENYCKTIKEYIARGHARKVPDDHIDPDGKPLWYLPHHPVIHEQKPGKVRVVFDCAARFGDTSLNDQLLQGPDLTNNLTGVLLRFRQEPVALMADVEQMFHQVRVAPDDCHALRFLWWEDGDLAKNPVDHQMLVHLFGATSSPCCASFALKKTARDFGSGFDAQTVDTVNHNFYVDDCLKSVATVHEASRLASQLVQLLAKGGFHLTKWISNSREVLVEIPAHERAPSIANLDLEDLPIDRALGTQWDVEADTLSFRVKEKPVSHTRRGMLSLISSLYDPLGFAAALILPAKVLLQELCRHDFGWDETVPNETLVKWRAWVDDLPKLRLVSWPRCFKPKEFGVLHSIQLHHFSDASEEGYGAASYLRLVDDMGRIHCGLVMGKSRVAPLKTITIPRMELTAAVVSVKLHKFIVDQLDLPIHKTIFWTDSTIVLQYIRNEARRFQTFVANRLSVIHDASSPCQWRHVDSLRNPADYASRGFSITETEKLRHWLNGPSFLVQGESEWPRAPDEIPELPDEDCELRRKHVQVHMVVQEDSLQSLLSRYSSLYKLLTSVAWLLRFKNYLRRLSGEVKIGNLTVDEIMTATKEVVKVVQRQAFPKELAILQRISDRIQSLTTASQRNKLAFVGYVSPLRKLNPVIFDGVIRVGGRLERASIGLNAKHPMILPGKHHVTDLIIRDCHEREGHVGSGQVLASIRQKFWILRGHAAVRRVIGKCLKCRFWNAKPCEQIMAPLPSARVTPCVPPFSSVGVDYFGPILVKSRCSQVKRYGCVFTCLAIRAVHIEIAHDLTTDSFIQLSQDSLADGVRQSKFSATTELTLRVLRPK